MAINKFSLVPTKYKDKDPRALPYLYPTQLNLVSYAKQMQDFTFYQSLEAAETVANNLDYILLPWCCIHWGRAQKIASDRKVKIGRKSFYMLKTSEMTKTEALKLENYIKELNKNDEDQREIG